MIYTFGQHPARASLARQFPERGRVGKLTPTGPVVTPLTSVIICRAVSTHAPVVSVQPVPVSSVTTNSAVSVGGITYLDRASTSGFSNYILTQSVPAFGAPWIPVSETPTICTVAGDAVTRASDGVGKIRLTGDMGFSKVLEIVFSSSTPAARRIWTGLESGSIPARFSNNLLAMLGPTKQLNYYSSGIASNAAITRNPNCWAASIDLTSSAVTTSFGGAFGTANSGCAITRRHWVGVPHWGLQVENMGPGAVLTFTDQAGNRHYRTVLSRYVHPSFDLMCAVLDVDLPIGVKILKLPSSHHRDTATGRIYGLGFQVTQEKNIALVGFDNFESNSFNQTPSPDSCRWDSSFISNSDPAHRLYGLQNHFQTARPGDSGGMICGLSSAGEPFLVSLFTGANHGAYLPACVSDLNAMIAAVDSLAGVSTGYAVGVLDVST